MKVDIWHNILWSRYKAGVFSALHGLSNSRGHDIRFFQIAETDDDRISLGPVDFEIHRYPYTLLFRTDYSSIPKLPLYAKCLRAAFSSDADLVVLAGYNRVEYWLQLLALRLRGRVVGVFCDSTAYDRPRSWTRGLLKSIFFGSCAIIFGYGERSRDYVEAFGVPQGKIRTRCQAAAVPDDYDSAGALVSRVINAAKPDHPRYLYIGRLSEEKNVDLLLRAFSVISASKPGATLRIVGGGGERQALTDFAHELGVASRVEFLGSLGPEGVWTEYQSATCLVLPSSREPWGLVVNEALAAGCPVVVSDRCGCVPELVVKGVTGFSFSSGDLPDLTRALRAAPDAFSDAAKTGAACIALAAQFTPTLAAEQILMGCLATRPTDLMMNTRATADI